MTQRLRTFGVAILLAGVQALSVGAQVPAPAQTVGILPTGFGGSVDRDIERVRAATAEFKTLDSAVKAGYVRDVSHCVDNPPQGAMGYHHENAALMDDRLQVDRPEILVYERMPGGGYRLNGVEYIVPISAWSRDDPPSIMGQKLKKAPSLGMWYLHVWVWQANPSGVFADWNPSVKC